MKIAIILVEINGRYKKKLKGQFMCQSGQRKRYVSMVNRTMCKQVHKKQKVHKKVSFVKGHSPPFQRAWSLTKFPDPLLSSLRSPFSPSTLKPFRGPCAKWPLMKKEAFFLLWEHRQSRRGTNFQRCFETSLLDCICINSLFCLISSKVFCILFVFLSLFCSLCYSILDDRV